MAGRHARRPRTGHRHPRRVVSVALAVLLILTGLAVALYPVASNMLAQRAQAAAIADYGHAVARLDRDDLADQWRAAREYNTALGSGGVSGGGRDAAYENALNIAGDGVMGYLTIPRIDVRLPIRHGTDEAVLAAGAGHMPFTALPTGGEGLHSVLTGHRGLPSAELFTRLDELERGDEFTVTVLDETHRYRVTDIRTVDPADVAGLAAQPGRDLVTLVTCTPYGINTHRLLVTGERDGDAADAGDGRPGSGATVRRGVDPAVVWLRRIGSVLIILAAVGAATAAVAIRRTRPRQSGRDRGRCRLRPGHKHTQRTKGKEPP